MSLEWARRSSWRISSSTEQIEENMEGVDKLKTIQASWQVVATELGPMFSDSLDAPWANTSFQQLTLASPRFSHYKMKGGYHSGFKAANDTATLELRPWSLIR